MGARIKCFWLEPVERITTEAPCNCGCGQPLTTTYTRYRRADTGEEYERLSEAPAGAMWDADWFDDATAYTGPDGIALCVQTPGGTWMVDSQASNCTRPGEPHKCWTRSGDPRTGDVDVGKQYGETCGAGAGSILCGSYHGFLRNGWLEEC